MGSSARSEGKPLMARLKSELEVICPCCQSTAGHRHQPWPGRLAPRAGPRQQARAERSATHSRQRGGARARPSSSSRSTPRRPGGDALSKRFEEALRQARDEPVTKPMRDFDLLGGEAASAASARSAARHSSSRSRAAAPPRVLAPTIARRRRRRRRRRWTFCDDEARIPRAARSVAERRLNINPRIGMERRPSSRPL